MSEHTRIAPHFVAARAASLEAVRLAASACRRAQAEIGSLRAATKDDRSPVTVADFAAQAVVADVLYEALGPWFERAGMVAEEDPSFLRDPAHAAYLEAAVEIARSVRPRLDAERLLAVLETASQPTSDTEGPRSRVGFFTLDPIDGTKGFLRGQQYSIALAYLEQGYPAVAALACPNLALDPEADPEVADPEGSLYVAVRDAGTEELACAGSGPARRYLPALDQPLDRPLRVVGSVEKAHSSVSNTDRVIAAVRADPKVVRLDSSAKYAVVARGQADVYLRLPTRADYVERIWDHAAGVLVAEEAGAVVSDVAGHRLNFGYGRGLEQNRGVVVAHPSAHPRIIVALAALGIA